MTVINVSRRKEDAGKIFSATSCPSCEALRGEAEGFGTLTPEITLQVQKGNRKMSSTAISEPVRGKSLGLSAAPTALRQRAAGVGFSLLCWGAYCCYKKPDSQLENRNTDFLQNRHNQDLKPTAEGRQWNLGISLVTYLPTLGCECSPDAHPDSPFGRAGGCLGCARSCRSSPLTSGRIWQ